MKTQHDRLILKAKKMTRSQLIDAIRKAADEKNPAAVALGSIKSEKKAASSRANGAKGGRPKKQPKE